MNVKKSIKDWAVDERPREKLLLKGASVLSNAELLAILISSGNLEETAVDLCKRILDDSGQNLAKLARLTISDLQHYKGIGEAKAITIAAALELGRRRSLESAIQEEKIKDSFTAFQILASYLNDLSHECFYVLLLSRANTLIKAAKISEGGLTATVVDPRLVFKLALDHKATGIILGHNHPSGQLIPSEQDVKLTQKLSSAGQIMEIPILDHIIVGQGKYYSFADEGML